MNPIREDKLEIITRQQLLEALADRYARQIVQQETCHHGVFQGKQKGDLLRALQIVDPNAPGARAEFDRLIGNGHWTALYCVLCGEDVESIAVIDEDYESGARICLSCAKVIVERLTVAPALKETK